MSDEDDSNVVDINSIKDEEEVNVLACEECGSTVFMLLATNKNVTKFRALCSECATLEEGGEYIWVEDDEDE